jgi:hypothetical protein
MSTKKMLKLLIVAAVLGIVLTDGLMAQQRGPDYEIINVEYLGDFDTDNPRDRAISDAVAKLQRRDTHLAYQKIMYPSHHELLAILRGFDAISERGEFGIDSTMAVTIIISAFREETKYIVFFQGLPFSRNPYYYWVYRGDRK